MSCLVSTTENKMVTFNGTSHLFMTVCMGCVPCLAQFFACVSQVERRSKLERAGRVIHAEQCQNIKKKINLSIPSFLFSEPVKLWSSLVRFRHSKRSSHWAATPSHHCFAPFKICNVMESKKDEESIRLTINICICYLCVSWPWKHLPQSCSRENPFTLWVIVW